jgi:hypothetical protein
MENDPSAFEVNPIVKEILAAGGQVFHFDGYMGPSDRERIHFYKNLALGQYLEISPNDIIHIMQLPNQPDGRCRIFVRSTAELRMISTVSFKAGDMIPIIATAQGQSDPVTIGRVYPPDNCAGRCQMEYITCIRSHGGDYWCGAELAACVVGCIIFHPGDFQAKDF